MVALVESFLTNMPYILLNPLTANQYIKHKNQLEILGLNYIPSECVDFFETATIAGRSYPGQLPMFTSFCCFRVVVWALIGISIIVLSLISTQQTLKLIDFYEFLWNYSTILFNKTFQKFIIHLKYNNYLGIWLIPAFILSFHFTACLLEFMSRTIPELRIDTLEQ